MKPEQILEIADKNGFDWWGSTTGKHFFNNDSIWVDFKITLGQYSLEATETRPFPLSDLATNKSFLEALIKEEDKSYIGYIGRDSDARKDILQILLIDDLTNNNGKDFWKICSEFIGETNE